MIVQTGVRFNPVIRLLKPLGFIDYVKLQMKAKAVLSDSGTISEEASILGLKALNIREAHERPEAMGKRRHDGWAEKDRILQGLSILESQTNDTLEMVSDYEVPNVSEKVLRIILSYTDYVNRVVWRK